MLDDAVRYEITAALERLPVERQNQILNYVRSIEKNFKASASANVLPPTVSGEEAWLALQRVEPLTNEEAGQMLRDIKSGEWQVEPDDWH